MPLDEGAVAAMKPANVAGTADHRIAPAEIGKGQRAMSPVWNRGAN
jgi:hypothetical protein